MPDIVPRSIIIVLIMIHRLVSPEKKGKIHQITPDTVAFWVASVRITSDT
jgi:hypothetical protein